MEGAGYFTYEIRVRAVEAVQSGMTVSTAAEAYRVDRSTVHRWISRFDSAGGNHGLVRTPVSGRKPGRVVELIGCSGKMLNNGRGCVSTVIRAGTGA